jgi:F0F1-type ATP synthase delta subunit
MDKNSKVIFLKKLTLSDSQVNRLVDKLGRFKSYSKRESELHMIIKEKQIDNEGLILFHNPFSPAQKIYYFNEFEKIKDEALNERVRVWDHKLNSEISHVIKSEDRKNGKILIYIERRKLKAIYDFDICSITPIFSTIYEPLSTVAELHYKGNLAKTDKNFLIDKRLDTLLITLISLFWRSKMSTGTNEILQAEFQYQKYRNPDKSIKDITFNSIYDRTNDSWWQTNFGNAASFQDIDRNQIDMENQYFLLHRSFDVPKDTNQLLNKYMRLNFEQQRAFHRAAECYKMALNYFVSNKYIAATYFAISIESLAKFEFNQNNPKELKKKRSSDYYKEFFYSYLLDSEYLTDLIGIIYKFRNEHVHEGFFPNKLWETTELNDHTLNAIENIVNYCLIRWLLNQRETILGDIYK